ncbi:biotin transporter BioY [Granulicella mallensis]|uniref:Biotin transporter n=1 Tax=Granulicella mallensis TaxID=940614 RepID=A0A7W8E9H1_9BACT|nr:biotin transporter BioY [Granulicella mallensis]MBB5062360.1 biotin transport system substrate-specific component [Granulicella mallensis]
MQNVTAAPSFSLLSNELLAGKILRVALGTLVLTASSWISIPLSPIPITMQTYAVIVIGSLFGARMGAITVLAWLAEAAIGFPVLAQGAAGLPVFFGPSVGYLVSFPVIAAFAGWFSDRKFDGGPIRSLSTMLAANAINLGLGVMWLAALLGWHRAVIVGFMPFWIGGIVKAVLATTTVLLIRGGRARRATDAR